MPIIGFKQEFVPDIKSGKKKKQTIRPVGKRKFKVGQRLYMYTGPYRPGERVKIGGAVVSEVVPLRVVYTMAGYLAWHIKQDILDNYLNWDDKMQLAKDDGFNSVDGFEEFFINTYKLKPGDSKDLNIIKWRDFEEA
jgi:hypothetical protein